MGQRSRLQRDITYQRQKRYKSGMYMSTEFKLMKYIIPERESTHDVRSTSLGQILKWQ